MAAQHVYQVSPIQVSIFLGELILIAEFIFSQSVWLDDKEEEDGAHVDINKIFLFGLPRKCLDPTQNWVY